MPKIPSVSSLTRRLPQDRTGVTRMSPGSAGQGLMALGESVAVAGDFYQQRQDDIATTELAQAQADYLSADSFKGNEIGKSKDYKNMVGAYTSFMGREKGRLAASITSTKARKAFVQWAMVKHDKGRQIIANKAYSAETNVMRARSTESIIKLQNSVQLAKTPEESAEIMGVLGGLTANSRLYSPAEALKIRRGFQSEAADGRLQIAVNGKNWSGAKAILGSDFYRQDRTPVELSNAKKKLKDAMETSDEEVVAQKSQDASDELREGDVEFEEGIERLGKLPVKFRDEAIRRFTNDFNRDKAIEAQATKDMYDEYSLKISDPKGEFTTKNIPYRQWRDIGPVMRSNLKKIEDQVARGKVPGFRLDHHINLSRLAERKKWRGLTRYAEDYRAEMSPDQRKHWGSISAKGDMPVETDDGLKDQQRVNIKFPDKSKQKKMQARMLEGIADFRATYQREHEGKNPNTDQVKGEVNRMFIEFTRSTWYGHESGTYLSMGPEEFKEYVTEVRSEDPKRWAAIEKILRKGGKKPRDLDVMEMHSKVQDLELWEDVRSEFEKQGRTPSDSEMMEWYDYLQKRRSTAPRVPVDESAAWEE